MSFRNGTTSCAALSPGSPPGKNTASSRGSASNGRVEIGEAFVALRGVVEVEVDRRPDPVVEIVAGADPADRHVHLIARQREQRADARVLKGNVLDAVGAEQRQLADTARNDGRPQVCWWVPAKLLLILRCKFCSQLFVVKSVST